MTRNLQIIIGVSAASVLTLSALGQDTPNAKADGASLTPERSLHAQGRERLNEAAKASDVIGMTVRNNQNEKLGKVEDLAVDVESGRIVQVILSTGGFIGVGDTLTAVPPGALHHDVAGTVLRLDADKEKLANAPKFEISKWAECSDPNHLSAVYRYYGQEPAFTFVQTGDAVVDAKRNKADGGKCIIPASRLSQVQKASKLMGASVKNLQDEKLGSVDNLLVDLPSGRVVAVIISTGGFLGMDDVLSAVPPTALRFTTDRDTLQLDASKELLSNAPHFKANHWPDFAQTDYAAGVYRAYKVEPYFTTGADNTARNVRDRHGRTLTPLDQGNSHADIDITAQIRKEIIATKEMSVDAKNVKIITKDGRVTLRGPVNSNEEKRLIGDIAERIAGAGNVDNQLEAKLTASNSN
jgi:sporulation protein YlmC with PRC-barrel domain